METHVPEYKPEGEGKLSQAQETANKMRQELLDRLTNGTISSARDLAEVVKIYGPAHIDSAIAELKKQLPELAALQKYMKAEAADKAQVKIENLVTQIQVLMDTRTGLLSPGDQGLEQFFMSMQNGDFPSDVGQKVSAGLKSGDLGQAVQAVVDEKIQQLSDNDPKKKDWNETMKKIGKSTLFAGGGLAALALYFAIMGGKREQ